MAGQKLRERLAILEERVRLLEPLSEHQLAIAHARVEARLARGRSERYRRWGLVAIFVPVAFWLTVDLVLVLR